VFDRGSGAYSSTNGMLLNEYKKNQRFNKKITQKDGQSFPQKWKHLFGSFHDKRRRNEYSYVPIGSKLSDNLLRYHTDPFLRFSNEIQIRKIVIPEQKYSKSEEQITFLQNDNNRIFLKKNSIETSCFFKEMKNGQRWHLLGTTSTPLFNNGVNASIQDGNKDDFCEEKNSPNLFSSVKKTSSQKSPQKTTSPSLNPSLTPNTTTTIVSGRGIGQMDPKEERKNILFLSLLEKLKNELFEAEKERKLHQKYTHLVQANIQNRTYAPINHAILPHRQPAPAFPRDVKIYIKNPVFSSKITSNSPKITKIASTSPFHTGLSVPESVNELGILDDVDSIGPDEFQILKEQGLSYHFFLNNFAKEYIIGLQMRLGVFNQAQLMHLLDRFTAGINCEGDDADNNNDNNNDENKSNKSNEMKNIEKNIKNSQNNTHINLSPDSINKNIQMGVLTMFDERLKAYEENRTKKDKNFKKYKKWLQFKEFPEQNNPFFDEFFAEFFGAKNNFLIQNGNNFNLEQFKLNFVKYIQYSKNNSSLLDNNHKNHQEYVRNMISQDIINDQSGEQNEKKYEKKYLQKSSKDSNEELKKTFFLPIQAFKKDYYGPDWRGVPDQNEVNHPREFRPIGSIPYYNDINSLLNSTSQQNNQKNTSFNIHTTPNTKTPLPKFLRKKFKNELQNSSKITFTPHKLTPKKLHNFLFFDKNFPEFPNYHSIFLLSQAFNELMHIPEKLPPMNEVWKTPSQFLGEKFVDWNYEMDQFYQNNYKKAPIKTVEKNSNKVGLNPSGSDSASDGLIQDEDNNHNYNGDEWGVVCHRSNINISQDVVKRLNFF